MADVVFVTVILAFFALCLGLVKACDRLLGPDELSSPEPVDGERPADAVGSSR